MVASLLLSILMAGAPDIAVPGLPVCDDAHAQTDFDRSHDELDLVGASPLYGLEAESRPSDAVRALAARSVLPVGAAPLFGLEAFPVSAVNCTTLAIAGVTTPLR